MHHLPCTLSLVLPSAVPAGFWATHMYVPESAEEALEICRLPLGSIVDLLPTMTPETRCRDWSLLSTDKHRQDYLPVMGMLMPSFCQVMVGLGEPVALQGRVMGLFRITSNAGGWDSITGSSEEKDWKIKKQERNEKQLRSDHWTSLAYFSLHSFQIASYTVGQDVFTLHGELHVAVGGACSIFSRTWVASSMTKLGWGDLYRTWVQINRNKK